MKYGKGLWIIDGKSHYIDEENRTRIRIKLNLGNYIFTEPGSDEEFRKMWEERRKQHCLLNIEGIRCGRRGQINLNPKQMLELANDLMVAAETILKQQNNCTDNKIYKKGFTISHEYADELLERATGKSKIKIILDKLESIVEKLEAR